MKAIDNASYLSSCTTAEVALNLTLFRSKNFHLELSLYTAIYIMINLQSVGLL